MKTLIFFAIIILPSFGGVGGGLFAQITLIPDPNFEQALIDLGIDSDGVVNGQVLTSDVEEVDVLDVSYEGILDLTGLQDFIALEVLNISHNALSSGVNLSNNILLKHLEVTESGISEINLENNVLLEYLDISLNWLTELDLSQNTLLKELYCIEVSDMEYNLITSFDFSNNLFLEIVMAENMPSLEKINLRNRTGETPSFIRYVCETDIGMDCTPNVCIEVDDPGAAYSGEFPYANLVIEGDYFYSEDCSLSIPTQNNVNVKIYPNPTTDEIFIHNPNQDNLSVRLHNIVGQLLIQKEFKSTNNKLSLKELRSGTYFLVIKNPAGKKVVKKVVKQ